jgi:hypothetical protein
MFKSITSLKHWFSQQNLSEWSRLLPDITDLSYSCLPCSGCFREEIKSQIKY